MKTKPLTRMHIWVRSEDGDKSFKYDDVLSALAGLKAELNKEYGRNIDKFNKTKVDDERRVGWVGFQVGLETALDKIDKWFALKEVGKA